jgi:hypothetical protein
MTFAPPDCADGIASRPARRKLRDAPRRAGTRGGRGPYGSWTARLARGGWRVGHRRRTSGRVFSPLQCFWRDADRLAIAGRGVELIDHAAADSVTRELRRYREPHRPGTHNEKPPWNSLPFNAAPMTPRPADGGKRLGCDLRHLPLLRDFLRKPRGAPAPGAAIPIFRASHCTQKVLIIGGDARPNWAATAGGHDQLFGADHAQLDQLHIGH